MEIWVGVSSNCMEFWDLVEGDGPRKQTICAVYLSTIDILRWTIHGKRTHPHPTPFNIIRVLFINLPLWRLQITYTNRYKTPGTRSNPRRPPLQQIEVRIAQSRKFRCSRRSEIFQYLIPAIPYSKSAQITSKQKNKRLKNSTYHLPKRIPRPLNKQPQIMPQNHHHCLHLLPIDRRLPIIHKRAPESPLRIPP